MNTTLRALSVALAAALIAPSAFAATAGDPNPGAHIAMEIDRWDRGGGRKRGRSD